MKLTVDKKVLSEGEYATVSWDCGSPDQASLVVVEGGSRRVFPLSDAGTMVVSPTGDSDTMELILKASIAGSIQQESLSVKVKRVVLRAEKVSGVKGARRDRASSALDSAKDRLHEWWGRTREEFASWWSILPPTKKLAWKCLLGIFLILLLSCFSPRFLPFGVVLLSLYLVYFIYRK